MLNGEVDLHLHSTCSDGLDTPEELVAFALENGYRAISITDHDTVAGIVRGVTAAENSPLELVPGIELSAMLGDEDIHILGYYIDYTDESFQERIAFFMEKRRERAEEIVKSLNYLGFDITIDMVLKVAHGAPIGRPHIAEVMLSENIVDTYNEAFIHYIGANGPAYVPKYRISPREAIALIRDTGGVAVLAHPAVLSRDSIIDKLVTWGVGGIEAVHPLHTPPRQRYYRDIAQDHNLVVTGGSDWHGASRRRHFRNIENSSIPLSVVDELKKRTLDTYDNNRQHAS